MCRVAALLVVGLALGCGEESQPSDEASPTLDEPSPVSRAQLSCPDDALSPAPLRRLTRFEYGNAIRDVFALDLELVDLFPRDEVMLGFDNQAGALSVTDLHVDGYLEAADGVATWLVERPERLAAIARCAPESSDCARQLIVSLGRRLERRPPGEAQVDQLLALFGSDFSPAGFAEGASRVVSALLQSPAFLYRLERSAEPRDTFNSAELASPWLLASRLGSLLLGSVPDESLLEAAAAGELGSAEDVERHARRLIDTDQARRGVAHFYLQWLDLADYGEVEKDRQLLTAWDDTLRAHLAEETARFVEAVLWQDDARFETLLTAPYSFVNARLSDLYGLPITDADSSAFERVDFGAGAQRQGLLTQGSILSNQAKADQTSPIHRGKFIREQFFCTVPPPPPPNIAVVPPRLDPRKTTRERFEQHRTDTVCAGCHRLLDPVGLAFEHYDAIGRYRATEAGAAIDATGFLSDTDVDGPLDGVPSLAKKLVESREVRSCLVTQWFRFTFGRGETADDACTLQKLEQSFERTDGDLGELLVALTQTEAFLRPTPAPAPEEDTP